MQQNIGNAGGRFLNSEMPRNQTMLMLAALRTQWIIEFPQVHRIIIFDLDCLEALAAAE
jgi:hypothetical protein